MKVKMRFARALACMLLLGTTVIASSPNSASAAGPYSFWFVKNWSDRLNSALYWSNNAWTEGGSWRAGSGRNTNECQTSAMSPINNGGWLPNGTWTVQFASANYNGSVIKGPAIRFNDRTCANGYTWRTEIFIHSKIPWPTGPNGEYMSQACVKVSSTGSTPATAGGDILSVYNVKMFLSITTMYVS